MPIVSRSYEDYVPHSPGTMTDMVSGKPSSPCQCLSTPRHRGAPRRAVTMAAAAAASYDQLAHQVAALRQENSHLRRELEDNSNHLCKLETETFGMKVALAAAVAAAATFAATRQSRCPCRGCPRRKC